MKETKRLKLKAIVITLLGLITAALGVSQWQDADRLEMALDKEKLGEAVLK